MIREGLVQRNLPWHSAAGAEGELPWVTYTTAGGVDEVCPDDVSCPAPLLRGLGTVISRGWVAVPKLGGRGGRDTVFESQASS